MALDAKPGRPDVSAHACFRSSSEIYFSHKLTQFAKQGSQSKSSIIGNFLIWELLKKYSTFSSGASLPTGSLERNPDKCFTELVVETFSGFYFDIFHSVTTLSYLLFLLPKCLMNR